MTVELRFYDAAVTIGHLSLNGQRIGYSGGSLLLLTAVLLSLLAWRRTTGSVAVETVATPRAELFYWVAITFSQTLGTALGDWVADAGPGYGGGALIFGAVLVALFLA